MRRFWQNQFPDSDLCVLISHFYCLIDKSLFKWFFKLDKKSIEWSKFVDEVDRIEQQQRELVHLKQTEFLDKLKKRENTVR